MRLKRKVNEPGNRISRFIPNDKRVLSTDQNDARLHCILGRFWQ